MPTATKSKWAKGQVPMALTGDDDWRTSRKCRPVPGIVCGIMGIAKPPECGWYSLTHMPTGLRVGGFRTLRGAKATHAYLSETFGEDIWERMGREEACPGEIPYDEARAIRRYVRSHEND